MGILIGAHLHAEAVFLARAPDVVGGVDKQLGIVVVLRVGDGMHTDTTRTVVAYAVDNALLVTAAAGIAADKAASIAALAVAVPDVFHPGVSFFAFGLRC